MEPLTVEGEILGSASPVQTTPGASQDIALRVRAWFSECWHHRLWVDYRLYSVEDEGFYVGGDLQWSVNGSLDELTRIRSLKRAAVSINNIQPVVDVLTGFERQNRFDLKAAPQGDEDAEEARKMTWLLKFVQEQSDAHVKCSEVFEDGVIKGMKACEIALDFQDDAVNGDIMLVNLEPGQEIMWDPECSELATLDDARFVLKYKYVYLDDILSEYPDKKEEILEAASALDIAQEPSQLQQGDVRDGYGGLGSGYGGQAGPLPRAREYETAKLFWDKADRKVMVIEAWYREYEDKWMVSDKRGGAVHEVETETIAKQAAAADPDNLTAIRRRRKIIRMAVVLPATNQVLEDGNPYENDEQAYPFAVFVAKKKGHQVYGIVRNLKDAQRAENKRESQAQDLLGRFANIRPMAESGSLETPATLKDPWSNEPIFIKPGHQPPTWYLPPLAELYKILASMADRNRMSIRESSGINTDLLGVKGDDASGIAIARRQAQGQVISTVFFDNFRRFRQALGQRLARRIQQSFTMEKTFRLTNEEGVEVFVTLNPAEAKDLAGEDFARFREERDKAGRPVLRDLSTIKYDIVISEAPSTPTMRATSLLALLEILKTLPGLAPAMLDLVVELAEIPDRAKILQRVRRMIPPQLLGEAPPAGPEQVPSGGPVKVPAQPTPPGRPTLAGQGAPGTGAPIPPGGPVA